MADWDDDSETLRANVVRVLSEARRDALNRVEPTLATTRNWHRAIMAGLTAPQPHYIGRFRGEAGLEACIVEVGGQFGLPPNEVDDALQTFEAKLQEAVAILDTLIHPDQDLTADDLGAILDLCAWTHSEWVRIHPFANGNGRTARLWVNALAMRYGVRPFLPLRPRPDGAYGTACAMAMKGNWQPMATLLRRLYREAVQR